MEKSTEKMNNVQYSQNTLKNVLSMVRGSFMRITTTELKTNQAKYLSLSNDEDIIITKNGKPIAKIVGLRKTVVSNIESLFGVLPQDFDEEAILKERALSL